MSAALRDTFPRVYAGLLPGFFDRPAPEEKKATCDACAMCQPAGEPPVEGVVYFRPDAKCCTFTPRLPNYLVGAILSDAEPAMAEGQRRVRARIAQRVGVSPRWLAPSRKVSILHDASRASSFGRSLMLRCPYFEPQGGLCTIWRHREADCSTFFCRYSAGMLGRAFWKSADAYLRRVEGKLAAHAAATLDPSLAEPPSVPGELTIEELEDAPPAPARYAAWWRAWEGREEAFYLACHELVRGLGPDDLERLVGPDALAELEAAHRELASSALPERLRLNAPAQVLADGVMVASYSRYEPIKLTEGLHEALGELGPDETVAEVRARLLRDHGVDLPEGMLFEFYRLGVLVPIADAPDSAAAAGG
jgi:Fe-S-cluster containining protein